MAPARVAPIILAALLTGLAGAATFEPGDAAVPEPVKVGTAWGVPGQTVRGSLKVAEAADGSPVEIPVAIVTGREPGPVVWANASSHGDEYGATRALQDVVSSLDPEELSGVFVAVLVANPPAFRALFRVNPSWDDLLDAGDVFPGRPDRFTTERIAAALFERVTSVADYFLDLHTGGDRFRQHPFVFYSQAGIIEEDRNDELARGFGIPTLWRDTERTWPGSAAVVFAEAGVPSFLIEVGGGQPLDPNDLSLQADAVRSFLRKVGVLPGRPAAVETFTILGGSRIVSNSRGGFFDAAVSPGDRISEGAALGAIVDVYGEVVETLIAPPGAEIVLGVNTYPASPTGGWLVEVGVRLTEVRGRGP
ncbi:MAG: succinylglutamate desuccinylase/aspartoacylase family protein [Acidobacteriota bacterium]